jgi:hypothetical protein
MMPLAGFAEKYRFDAATGAQRFFYETHTFDAYGA